MNSLASGRQAVVLVHGVGEQQPMQTLKAFVDHLLCVSRVRRSWWSRVTSPPQFEDERDEGLLERRFSYSWNEHFSLHILHHAAPFAGTRWTNLYFDSDPIGGKVRQELLTALDLGIGPQRPASTAAPNTATAR